MPYGSPTCCNGIMNAMNDARPQWQHDEAPRDDARQSGSGTPQDQGTAQQTDRFFSWIRDSRLTRPQERWIGGVCGGIAELLGWSPTLVRALMVGSVLLYGFGAAFYAFAWFLLPDRQTGVILAQQLIDGAWDWVMLGPLVCLALAVIMPGFGLVITAIGAGVMFVLIQHQTRYWRHTDSRGTYQPDQPYQPDRPYQPNQAGQQPSAAQQPSAEQTPPQRPTQPNSAHPFVAPQPNTALPNTAGTYADRLRASGPYATGSSHPRKVRRKPAGFAIVLAVLAAISLTVSWILFANQGVNAYLEPLLRFSLFGIAGICLLIGAVLLVLGLIGRRAGGLIPLAWIAAVIAVCLVIIGGGYSYVFEDMNRTNAGYTKVSVSGYRTLGADDAQLTELRNGVAFQGASPLNGSAANIDLSQYAKLHGTHTLSVGQGDKITTTQSGCPAGVIKLTAYKTQVYITLPDGCSYGFGDSNRYVDVGRSSMGNRYSAQRAWSGFAHSYIGFEDWETDDGTRLSGDNYQWLGNSDKMPTNGPELIVDATHVMDATIVIQYQSESHMPSYDARS